MAGLNEAGSVNPTRRAFLKASAVAGSTGVYAAMQMGPQVFAAGSDAIRVGMIGCGGRNTGAAAQALTADKGAT